MKTSADPAPDTHAEPGRAFFVSVIDGDRFGILAGPYQQHGHAAAALPQVKQMARKADPFASFYRFGTCQAPEDSNPVFGRV